MPTIALFCPWNVFNRVALCAICTGPASKSKKYIKKSRPPPKKKNSTWRMQYTSGETSDKGHSERGQTSQQRTSQTYLWPAGVNCVDKL